MISNTNHYGVAGDSPLLREISAHNCTLFWPHNADPANLALIRAGTTSKMAGKLLHCFLDWDEVQRNREVFHDMQKILHIRNANRDVLHSNHHETNLVNVPYEASPASEVKPYVRFLPGQKAIIAVGNERTDQEVRFTLRVLLQAMQLRGARRYQVIDLWTDRVEIMTEAPLGHLAVVVPKDKSPGGGGLRKNIVGPSRTAL